MRTSTGYAGNVSTHKCHCDERALREEAISSFAENARAGSFSPFNRGLLPDRSIRNDVAVDLLAHLPSRKIIGIIMAGGARDDMVHEVARKNENVHSLSDEYNILS